MKVELVIGEIFNDKSDPRYNVLMLKEKDGERKVMLVVGLFEAQCIATSCEDIKIERPLSHDLFEPITAAFGIKLKYVEINKVVNGTFHSLLCYERDGEERFVDARTSDALAIALRVDAPMYIEEELLDKLRVTDEGGGRFSVPVAFARLKTLREALEIAIKEEKYELAMQLKEEIDAREEAEKKVMENKKNKDK